MRERGNGRNEAGSSRKPGQFTDSRTKKGLAPVANPLILWLAWSRFELWKLWLT
jgi:hypothetical protein